MARVVSPLLSQEARGSITGLQFSRNPSGPTVGRKSLATYRETQSQHLARNHLATAHHFWTSLPQAAKDQWALHSRPGLTARQIFITRFARFLRFGITDPPQEPNGSDPAPLPYAFYWKPNFFGPGQHRLSWTTTGPQTAYYALYLADTCHPHIPHVRKLIYRASCHWSARPLQINHHFSGTHAAGRILIVSAESGAVLQDTRWILSTTLQQTLNTRNP